ncbi:MAG: MBL fold metallo-hydrolase [Marinilabiliaceae bacterium]|nr:MBL fold metallo-hydrolase [Marinilabiliaceae bacterium]
MILKVISTGSKGNAYILQAADGETLLIEAGVAMSIVGRHIKDMKMVRGCLITHEHIDHTSAINSYTRMAIDLYMTQGTFYALKSGDKITDRLHRYHIRETLKPFSCGKYQVIPFPTKHDAAQPVGYLIQHPECGKIVFATDTASISCQFKGVGHWIVECNYMEAVLHDRLCQGAITKAQYDKSHTHMCLHDLVNYLSTADLSQTKGIYLIHLSDGNSDEAIMKRVIEERTGIRCKVTANKKKYVL